jgi:short-subunit dehydrogenase
VNSAAFPFAMLRLDVTDEDSVQRGIQSIVSREGRLDIVVNNAGFGLAGPVEFTSEKEARREFDVNFFGVLRVCRAALPIMRRQGRGCIVNIGSIGGLIAIPYQSIYSASKFALLKDDRGASLRGECLRHQGRPHRAGRPPHGVHAESPDQRARARRSLPHQLSSRAQPHGIR